MRMILHQFELPLRHVFTISRESSRLCRTLIVELQQDGLSGFGEAGESAYYGASIEGMVHALERVRPQVEATRLQTPAAFWHSLAPQLRPNTFAQCALDTAAHDLWGKLRGQPVWRLWGLRLDRLPPSDYTIGIDTIERMVRKMQEFPDWPVYKIKLGTPDDLQIVRELRRHTDAVFRVDANGAWDLKQTLRKAGALKDLGVELIEQPLAPDCGEQMTQLVAESPLPVIADESCRLEPDVDRCAGHFHGVNIKLVKCGGLTPARRMIGRARQLGLKTMVGCMTESSVGISAAAQLLPLLDYADMDGALLLAQDIAAGVTFQRGQAIFPDRPGCGAELLASGSNA